MKKVLILFFAILFVQFPSFGNEYNGDSLLKKVDISDPYYGNKIYGYGNPKINFFHSKDASLLLVYQSRYGGDGGSTPNILKLFKFKGDTGKKLIDINIDSVRFIKESYFLKFIRGHSVYSLCHVCDGWDAALPEDNFFIPILIDAESLKIKADLTEKGKQDILTRFEQQAKKNIEEQLSYKNKSYPKYVEKIKSMILKLLNGQQ